MFNLIHLISLVTMAANPWLAQQKSFQESPQYSAIRQDRSYPAMVIPADINDDGFTDAWVMVQNKQGRGLELWQQQPLSERRPQVEYERRCQWPLLPGSDLVSFTLEDLGVKTPVAVLITKEDSPEEGKMALLAVGYQPGRGCRELLRDQLITRPYMATNEGRRVLAPAGHREGYFIETQQGKKLLVKEDAVTAVTFRSSQGPFDLLLSRQRTTYHPDKHGKLVAAREPVEITVKQAAGLARIKENHWALSVKEPKPASLLQLTFGCPGQKRADLSQKNLGTLYIRAGQKQLALPLGGGRLPAEVAAWSNLSGSAGTNDYYHLLFLLKEPVAEDHYQLLYQPAADNNEPICLHQLAIRRSR